MALFKSPVGEEIETLFKAIPGFKGFLSLVELDADKVLAVVLYETEAHANAAADSPQVKEIWSKVADLVNTETVVRKVYQVAGQM